MNIETKDFVAFIPALIIFIILWLDSKFGMDRIETENNGEKNKPWLKQKITVGRNPHVEYSTYPDKSERWKIIIFWLVICSIIFLFMIN